MWATNIKVVSITLAVVAFYTMIASIIPQLESEVPEEFDFGSAVTTAALVVAGERLYNGAAGCATCHGLGTRAPNLLTDHGGEGAIGARCGTRDGDCKNYLYEALTEPGTYLIAGFANIMPDMRRQLPEDQIWALVAYLQSVGGEVTVTAADLPQPGDEQREAGATASQPTFSATLDPQTLLQEKGCLGCHQLDGAGAPIGPPFDGMGARITSDRIRTGIIDPNAEIAEGFDQFAGVMPAFFGEQLSAAQLEAIVQFLEDRR
ncbi:MAG: c-type cytochrome [Gemmatimonadetes bacterium]|nr:c-type cytochrome [Gemmatimonadota bacterium]